MLERSDIVTWDSILIQGQNFALVLLTLLIIPLYAQEIWRNRKDYLYDPAFSLSLGIVLTATGVLLHKSFWAIVRACLDYDPFSAFGHYLLEHHGAFSPLLFLPALLGYTLHLHVYVLTRFKLYHPFKLFGGLTAAWLIGAITTWLTGN